jgi:urease accessory protein
MNMLIREKTGTLNSIHINNRHIDWLELEWYETSKRILHKRTRSGKEITLKFLNNNPALTQDDVLFEDTFTIIAVHIIPCEVLAITPASMFEMASVCYEIGNKHLPLFFDQNEVLVPFDKPLYRLLLAQGYTVKQDNRKLIQPLKTTVTPHGHNSTSLFSKIMQLTNSAE